MRLGQFDRLLRNNLINGLSWRRLNHGLNLHVLFLSCIFRTAFQDTSKYSAINSQQRYMSANTEALSSDLEGLNLSTAQKSTGKQRKIQTEEEFLEQKRQFQESGPKIDTEDWLFDEEHLSKLNNDRKLDRVAMLHACEKAYFLKDYTKCLDLIEKAEVLFGVKLDNQDTNETIKQDFSNAGKKTKKSCKVERHVIELLHIKEKCVAKMTPGQ